jgi:S1-C subfamily serine protease
VSPGGPAERHGLEAGDRIVAVNGQPIRNLDQYGMLLDGSGGWAKITLIDHRTRKTFNCAIRLEPVR